MQQPAPASAPTLAQDEYTPDAPEGMVWTVYDADGEPVIATDCRAAAEATFRANEGARIEYGALNVDEPDQPTLAQIVEAEGRATFTPGPWVYARLGETTDLPYITTVAFCCDYVIGLPSEHAGGNYRGGDPAGDPEADARLIAAAPALYDACNGYRKAFEALFNHCLSNGVFNAWGKSVDCSELNKAQSAGEAALRLAEAGS